MMKERSKSTEIQFLKKISVKCVFCDKLKQHLTASFSVLLIKALYSKYSSSQNYYYSKLINDILENESTELVVKYRDLETRIEEEEYFKRFYYQKEVKVKQGGLLEYYKYHKDIPRLFMQPSYHTIYRFHEKKRRIEYGKIKRQLGIQEEVKDETEAVDDEKKQRQKTSQDCSIRQLKNLLQGVNLEESSYLQIKFSNQQQQSQSITQLKDIIAMITVQQEKKPQYDIKSQPQILQFSLSQQQQKQKQQHLNQHQLHQPAPIQQHLQKSLYAQEQIQKLLIQQKREIVKQPSAEAFKKIELPVKLTEDLRNKQSTAPKLRSQKQNGLPQSNQAFSQSIEQQLTHRSKQELYFDCINNYNRKGAQASNSNFNLNEIEKFFQSKESFRRPDKRNSLHNANTNQQQQKSKTHIKQMSLGQNTFQQQIQTLKSLYNQSVKETRTKSSDQVISPTRPPSSSSKEKWNQQVKFSNNVYVQGQKKQPQIYTINQNNVVNIYLDDIKNSFKSVSLTSRGQSPQRFATRRIFNCDQQLVVNQKNVSPLAQLRKK